MQPGDLLFAWSGTVGSSFGPRIWRGETGVLNQHIFKVSPSSKTLSSPYALRLLESAATHIANQSHGFKASFVHVKKRDLEKTVAAFPQCQREQKRICEALADIDAYLDATKAEVDKKRNIKHAAMQELLTGKRRLPGFEGEWEVKRLGEIALIDPESLGGSTQPDYRFNYISLEDVDQGSLLAWSEQEFASAPSRARRKLQRNDVLISTVRPNLKSHLLFSKGDSEWVCSTGFSALRCIEDLADPGYLCFHLFGHFINKQIEALLTGSNYPAINGRDVRGLQIPVPTLLEQKEIARVLGSIEEELISLVQQAEKASSLKQGMMQQLLTGKIRLK